MESSVVVAYMTNKVTILELARSAHGGLQGGLAAAIVMVVKCAEQVLSKYHSFEPAARGKVKCLVASQDKSLDI